MKTAKAHNDQLTGYTKLLADIESVARLIPMITPKLNRNLHVIDWKAYPKNKPDNYRDYLVTRVDSSVHELSYTDRWWRWGTSKIDEESIVAFAELPEPYKEEQ